MTDKGTNLMSLAQEIIDISTHESAVQQADNLLKEVKKALPDQFSMLQISRAENESSELKLIELVLWAKSVLRTPGYIGEGRNNFDMRQQIADRCRQAVTQAADAAGRLVAVIECFTEYGAPSVASFLPPTIIDDLGTYTLPAQPGERGTHGARQSAAHGRLQAYFITRSGGGNKSRKRYLKSRKGGHKSRKGGRKSRKLKGSTVGGAGGRSRCRRKSRKRKSRRR